MTAAPAESDLPPSAPVIFEARGLRLGYNGRPVLDGVDLQVRAGEFWFLVGPNGQGKTTLLMAMLGRLRPQAGQLQWQGDFARPDRIGFVPQDCALNPTLPTTVQEFVTLGLVGIRAGRTERAERLREALTTVGLEGMGGRDFWSLSAGQRQRALVARALVRRPRLFVADEPTSGLDLSVEAAIYEILAELNRKQQLTVVLVAHDLAIAARYGSHLAVVHQGGVTAAPTPEILRSGVLERAYGTPIEVSHEASGYVHVRLGPARRPV